MLSWKRAFLPVLALALVAAPAVVAEGEKGDWEAGFYGGYALLDDYNQRGLLAPLNLDDEFLIGVRGGYWYSPNWNIELSVQNVGTEAADGTDADINSFRFNWTRSFAGGETARPFITFGIGDEDLDLNDIGSGGMSFNIGTGLRAWVTDNVALRADARYVWADHGSPVPQQSNIETTVGLSVIWGGADPADSDGDGVPDRKDRCPDTPRGATVDADGCPADSDGDGVYDGIDACPDTPKGHEVDDKGCSMDSDGDGVHDGPDKCPDTPKGATVDASGCPADSDGDGVYDGIDRCPDTPKGAKVDKRGCPMDSDGDGVYDGIDKCPNTPKGVTVVDKHGCPQDSDGDGVYDGIDQCPDTPKGVEVDDKGCAVALGGAEKTLVLENVLFEFNSAALTAESKAILDPIAALLVDTFPDVRIEIGGHTDSVGSEAYNRTLSQRRAESVVAHFASKGVDASRLSARGYGEVQPVATNDTDEGRARNRRVELRRLN